MKSKTTAMICMVGATAAFAPAKDITTRTNPDGTLNVEARYLVHVGFTGYNAGLTFGVGYLAPGGLMEYANSAGNSGNWGRINNRLLTIAADGNFTPNTFGGTSPDYVGYLFNYPARVESVGFWNRTYGDGGTFAAAPEVQYLDGPAPIGTWHTVPGVTWSTAYNPDYLPADEVREYQITLPAPQPHAWGIRLIGETQAGADDDGPGIAGSGFLGVQELVVNGSLEVGEIDLSRNLAQGNLGLSNLEHAGIRNNLTDGDLTTTTDTWSFWGFGDYVGVAWPEPQYRIAALGFLPRIFGDGGTLDECTNGFTVEYTTDLISDPNTADAVTWTPVNNLQKGRYPLVWQQHARNASQVGFLFPFDELSGITGLRIKGDGSGMAGFDFDGFLGAWELEVFGIPVLADAFDFNDDGDIDEADATSFGNCMSGPEIPQTEPACTPVDADRDGDVDMDDYALFQICYTGEGGQWDPTCGD